MDIHLNGAFAKSIETSYETKKFFSLISKSLISMIIRWKVLYVFIHYAIPAQQLCNFL